MQHCGPQIAAMLEQRKRGVSLQSSPPGVPLSPTPQRLPDSDADILVRQALLAYGGMPSLDPSTMFLNDRFETDQQLHFGSEHQPAVMRNHTCVCTSFLSNMGTLSSCFSDSIIRLRTLNADGFGAIVSPEVTQGPYYHTAGHPIRQNIAENQLGLLFVNLSRCYSPFYAR